MKQNKKRLKIIELKEQKDKLLLKLEIFIGLLVTVLLFVCMFISSFVNIEEIYRIIIVSFGVIQFIIGCMYCLKIEQIVGHYECKKCHHRYIPTFSSVLWAMHVCRTRYMKCPKCGKRSWNKKVLFN